MRIEKISIEHFRVFENLSLRFPKSNFITVIGKNGSGKTSFLDAVAQSLYTIIHDILLFEEQQTIQSTFNSKDISIGFNTAKIESEFSNNGKSFSTISEHEAFIEPMRINDFSFLSSTLQENDLKLSDLIGFPMLKYYRIDRSLSSSRKKKPSSNLYFKNKKVRPYYNALFGELPLFSELSDWWINEENYENEKKLEKQDLSFKSPSLEIIRRAVSKAFDILQDGNGEYSDIQVKRRSDSDGNISEQNYSAELFINVRDRLVRLNQLSSGEKSILLIVSDIARCLGIYNDFVDDSLDKEGIVLIDEIDLHLHPKWQRKIIKALTSVFPNIQFISTTHSPQILSTTKKEDVIFFSNGKTVQLSTDPKGRDANGILEEIFGVDERPFEVDELIQEIFQISNLDQLNDLNLKRKVTKLESLVAEDDPILIRIKTMLKRKHSISI